MLPTPGRTAILVLGMHRSGTSAVTGLLGELGVALPVDPIGATIDNPRGYFESRAVVTADDRLIRTIRSSWFDPRPLDVARLTAHEIQAHRSGLRAAVAAAFGEAALFALKDPRQCRFVPFVTAALAEADIATRAVLVLREPREVAASLCARDATIPSYGVLLWLRHMLDAERDTRAMPRIVIDYAALLDDRAEAVARLASLTGTTADAALGALLDPALRRRRIEEGLVEGALADLAADAWRAFGDLYRNDGARERDVLDGIAARLAASPWLEGDIVHDELRHRRVPAAPVAARPAAVAPAEPAAVPATAPQQDADAAIRIIRDSGLFDAAYYLDRYPDVRASGIDPIRHYVEIGAPEGRNPSAHFNTAYYARQMARRRGPAVRP